MEKIYILVNTGEEVTIGKTIKLTKIVECPIGESKLITTIPVNNHTIPELIKQGIIIEKFPKEEPKDLEFYVAKFANSHNLTIEEAHAYLQSIGNVSSTSLLNILLKTIAIDLDKKYPDYIGNSENIFVISLLNGRITQVNKVHIKNYRNFAAFRSIEDAKIACHICRDLIKSMFNE